MELVLRLTLTLLVARSLLIPGVRSPTGKIDEHHAIAAVGIFFIKRVFSLLRERVSRNWSR